VTFLGIDIGTSEVKAILTDDDQTILATSGVALRVASPHPGWSEQNPEDWWHATLDVIAAIRAFDPVAFSGLRGIALSGQMHGATLLDKQQHVLRAAILWNDTRAYAECVELEALVPESRRITGNQAMPGFTAPKLLWLQKYEPALFRAISKVLLPKDYVALRLTGDFISDMSDAAGTLWLDVAKRDWSERMLSATSLGREHMPRLFEGNQAAAQIRPELCAEWGIRHAVVLAGGAGDNAAAAVGLGVVAPGTGLLSLGTSGVLFAGTEKFAPNPGQGVHAFCHALPARWHQMSVILSAAASLAWLGQITGCLDIGVLAAEAENAAANVRRAPLFLPYLSGERTPHNDANARGVFFGLDAAHTRGDLAYGVMEGVAFAMADGYAALQSAGTRLTDVSFVGGGSRSRFWAQLCADAAGLRVLRHDQGASGGTLGAARLAQMAATGRGVEDICTRPAVLEKVEPQAAGPLQERLQRYRRLYPILKEEFTLPAAA
jgi:xylulokinase